MDDCSAQPDLAELMIELATGSSPDGRSLCRERDRHLSRRGTSPSATIGWPGRAGRAPGSMTLGAEPGGEDVALLSDAGCG